MKQVLERSRYVLWVIVIASFFAFLTVIVWGLYKTVFTIGDIVNGNLKGLFVTASLLELLDTYLIAAVFYIFAVAIHELFIGDLDLPAWLVIHNLDELKYKLVSVIVLVIVITFLKNYIEHYDSPQILESGISAAIVSGVLILFNRFSSTHT